MRQGPRSTGQWKELVHLWRRGTKVELVQSPQHGNVSVAALGNTYVLLDIFSIPQIHVGCKLLAVNSLYVYAIAAVVSLLSRQILSCQHQRVLRGINYLQCRHPPNVHNEFILWINCEWCASVNYSWILCIFLLNAGHETTTNLIGNQWTNIVQTRFLLRNEFVVCNFYPQTRNWSKIHV